MLTQAKFNAFYEEISKVKGRKNLEYFFLNDHLRDIQEISLSQLFHFDSSWELTGGLCRGGYQLK